MSLLSTPVETAAASASPRHPTLALLARYGAVFQAAWQARRELAGPRRLADEQAFLPAALSLQETPIHPAPRRAAVAICALFAIALAWACLGEVDVVAIAPGRIIVGERSKLVQPLETSVVRAIHVRDGDQVQAGQLLVELDPTAAQADGSRVTEERRAALGEALRARALLAALDGAAQTKQPRIADGRLHDPEQLVDAWRPEDQRAADTQLQAEWQEHRAKLDRLNAEQQRRSAELGTTRELLAKLRATVPLSRQRESDYKGLTEQGFMSGHAGQDRTRERIELERDLATTQARLVEAQASLAESKRSQNAYLAETHRIWQDRAAQARLKLAALMQEHAKASQRSQQTRLSAAVAGTVQQLAIHTPGGVVTPAQALMVIVPAPSAHTGETIAEVSIENKDIGFVHSGQPAEVKFETFHFTRYGTVPATVLWVTADAVVQPVASGSGAGHNESVVRGGGQPSTSAVFPARLLLHHHNIGVDGKQLRLSPGLNLTAEVKIGKRRVIDFLLSPVQKHVGESLRER